MDKNAILPERKPVGAESEAVAVRDQPAAEPPAPAELKPKQLDAIALLTSGYSAVAVAKQLDIDRTTVERWKREPLFKQELDRLVQDRYDDLRLRRVHLADLAFDALESVMQDTTFQRPCVEAAKVTLMMLGMLNAKKKENDEE